MLDKCWAGLVMFTLLVPPTMGQVKRLFPDELPQVVDAKVGHRVILIPDGTDGLHYFPDGPLCFLSTRPLRFLMPAANGTVLMAGQGFGDVSLHSQIMSPSGSGPDANYAGVYSIWRRTPRDRYVAIYHGEDHEDMGKVEGNDIPGGVWSACLAMIDPASGQVDRRGEILSADKPKQPIAGKPHDHAPNNVAKTSLIPDSVISRSRLRPKYGQGWQPRLDPQAGQADGRGLGEDGST